MRIRNSLKKTLSSDILFLGILLLVSFFGRAQYTPGDTQFGTNNYIEYIPGDIPIIISVPHGGYLQPSSIPDRSCSSCVTGSDIWTQEVAYELDSALRNVFGGIPHIIINKLHRIKLDANREIVEAALGDPAAELAWSEYHDYLQAAKDQCVADFGSAIYIDLHAHGHPIQRVELGYLITKTELQNTDPVLNTLNYQNSSSIKHLKNTLNPSSEFSELLRGNECMGEYLESYGYPSVPSASDPAPLPSDPYFAGGYNTVRHGSRDSSDINGIQFELNYTGIRNTNANRNAFARALACVLRSYLDKWYFDLDTWDPGNIVTTNLDSGPGSLRSALLGASDGDTITFAPALFGDTIQLKSELQICSDLTIMGPPAQSISISGGDSCRIMRIMSGHHLKISALNLVHGSSPSGEDGGAILVHGSIHLTNCLLADNFASDDGGAISVSDLDAIALLDSCTLFQNSCGDDGGALRCYEGQLTVNSSSIKNSTSPSYGGGLSSNGIVTLTNSTFSQNHADGHGGAIRNFGSGVLSCSNTTISENSCGISGAGISSSSSVSLNFCSITHNNSTSSTGGVRITSGANCDIHNTLISENTGSSNDDVSVSGATFNSQGFNLIGDSTGSNWIPINGDILGNSTSPFDAQIGVISNNGGFTETVALFPTSPCIDMADTINILTTDQRGFNRPSGIRSDIGAFELCQTTAMTDTQFACNSFIWIDATTYFSDTTGPTFTLTNVNGCDSIITLDLTLEQIDIMITTLDETITANTPNSTYQWLDCDNGFAPISGATNQSYSPLTNGNYAVVLTQNGCSDTSNCALISTVSTTDIYRDDLLFIYPNPTSGNISIEFNGNPHDIHVRLINTLGQEIMNESFDANEKISFNISAQSGIYCLEISSPTLGLLVSKLVKY
ncbi:MAG: hypothetical protein COA38_21195 [Fluviicola sp.]|nr:MAG: hypothetical protein COA38_21195 [Fluviicola sp.]